MENEINYKTTGIISKIFENHWNTNEFSQIIKYHPNANKEINKIINCSNHNLGTSVYVCPNDDEVFFCHHTCKCRLCSSCDIKSQKIKTNHILQRCLNITHRHITFTVPNDLVSWFFFYLNSNNLLFEFVSDTIYSIVNGKVNKKNSKISF